MFNGGEFCYQLTFRWRACFACSCWYFSNSLPLSPSLLPPLLSYVCVRCVKYFNRYKQKIKHLNTLWWQTRNNRFCIFWRALEGWNFKYSWEKQRRKLRQERGKMKNKTKELSIMFTLLAHRKLCQIHSAFLLTWLRQDLSLSASFLFLFSNSERCGDYVK